MTVVVTNVLRRAQQSGAVSGDAANMAHAEPLTLAVELYPYEPAAARVWRLRDDLTPYDAWYVVLAEQLEAPMAMLHLRLSRSTGARCDFLAPASG